MRSVVTLPRASIATFALRGKWLFLLLAQCTLLFALALWAKGSLREQLQATVALVVFQSAAMAWVLYDDDFNFLTHRQIFTTSGFICAAGFFLAPLLEDDHFRFLWDGYITATTFQPYKYAPDYFFGATLVPELMQAALSGINHPEIPTLYGPALQAIFALSYVISPGALWPLKIILSLGVMLTLWALMKSKVSPRWLMVFALHPLLVKESVVSAHLDVLIGCALAWAVVFWQRQHYAFAALAVSLAVAMKLSCVVALPFFFFDQRGRPSSKAVLAAALSLAILYAPLLLSTQSEAAALTTFGATWLFNPLLFIWVAKITGETYARAGVALIFLLAWLTLAIRWRVRMQAQTDALVPPPLVAVLSTLIVLSPVVNPWYWLWVLPRMLCRVSERWVALALVVALVSYSHVIEGVPNRFEVPVWATALQMVAIAVVLAVWFARAEHATRSLNAMQNCLRNQRLRAPAVLGAAAATIVLTLAPPYTPSWGQIDGWISLRYPQVRAINTGALQWLMASQSVLILDVRSEAEFAVSHLPAARNVPLSALKSYAERSLANTARDATIVVYCAVGVRSAQAADALAEHGFTRVHNLQGSIFKWASEDRPLAGGNTVHPYDARFGKLLPVPLRAL